MCGGTQKRKADKVDSYYRCPTKTGLDASRLRKCDNPYFRVNIVDTKVWTWLEELIFDKEKLLDGLRAHQEKMGNHPLEHELQLVKSELAKKEAEFNRAMADMKAAISNRAKTVIAQDIAKIETQLDALEKRQNEIEAELKDKVLTDEQITDIMEYAARMRENWEVISQDIDSKREALARLNIEVTLFVEDGRKKAAISGKVTSEEQFVCLENTLPY
jgi:hypothetical protein